MAVGHRDHQVLTLSRPSLPSVPPAPVGLLKATEAKWEAYWLSPVSSAADPVTDRPALERLFQCYDEHQRVGQAFRKQRTVDSRDGGERVNPLLSYLRYLSLEITKLEDRFGLTPRSRLALGVTLGQAKRSLSDLITEVGYDDD
ncbi:MAG: P27 family phage terminase small subunit [Gemmatimonadaceae bacterium]